MTTYNLTVQFDVQDLNVILQASELVTIVYGVSAVVTSATPALLAGAHTNSPSFVWLAFSPLESNVVSWTDSYALYASSTVEQNGVVVRTSATTPAVSTTVVPFQANGAFGAPLSGAALPADHYGIVNQYNPAATMTFGLCAGTKPVVNGNPVNDTINTMSASIVPLHQNVQLAASNSLQIFLQTGTSDGMTLPNSIANVAPISFNPGRPNITVRYNSSAGRFEEIK